MDEDKKVTQLAIVFKNRALDWFMSLAVKSPQGSPKIVVDVKKALINEFQRPSLEDQHMNEMIEIRQKPQYLVWEIYHKFKQMKGKLKYPITDMQHRKLFINSLLPHFKYPLRQQKFQTQSEALQ
jgi:hypothetical protein